VTATAPDYEELFREAPAGYVVADADGIIVAVNDLVCAWIDRARHELVGTSFHRLLPAGDRIMFVTHAMPQLDEAGAVAELSADLLGGNRERIPVLMSVTRTVTADGTQQDRFVLLRAAERRLYEQELATALRSLQEAENARQALLDEARNLALHDTLTGLANRSLLERATQEALITAAVESTTVGLLFFDVNRFKRINDSLGHSAGDEVLRHVGSCLRAAVRGVDMVARYSGDEFVILVPRISDEADLVAIEDRVRAELLPPTVIAGRSVSVGVAVGRSMSSPVAGPHLDVDALARELIDVADAAMYETKARTRGQPLQRQQSADRLRLETDLRGAAARGELVMDYQPQFDGGTLALVAVEALVRWQHPDLGLLPPGAFIGIAEESDLIDEIGGFALVSACAFGALVHGLGHPLEVAVNVSGSQLLNPSFGAFVEETLAASGLPGRALTLEITESKVISQSVIDDGILHHLRGLGVGISVDDFGTGYSSLSHLHRLPVTEVKIDRSFVAAITDEESTGLIAGVIGLGRGLKLRIIAEGIETPAQLKVLQALGCDRVQGYLLGRPAPQEALHDHLPVHLRAAGATVGTAVGATVGAAVRGLEVRPALQPAAWPDSDVVVPVAFGAVPTPGGPGLERAVAV
jgi:diguanylate cyclase (GGDEF)-like protein